MINLVEYYFQVFLTLMEEPSRKLSKAKLKKLEDKIISEIKFHRKRKTKRRYR